MPSIFALTGSVTSTGELRQSKKGSNYLRFEIRVNEDELVPVIAFNELADDLAQKLTLGHNVVVTGSVHGTKESLNAKYIDISLFANEVINLNNKTSKNNNSTQTMQPKKEMATNENSSTFSQTKVPNNSGSTFNKEKVQKKLTETEQKLVKDATPSETNAFSENFNKPLENNKKKSNIVKNGESATNSDRALNNTLNQSSLATDRNSSNDSEANKNADQIENSGHDSNFDFPNFQDNQSNDDSFF